MIKFSIITCTYNAESVLQRTLDSVMKQTCCNVEHLIIDGKSKDKTLAMVKAYKHKNDVGESAHEIRVFSEPDKGLYDAMNKGIDRATGDYLVFLNAGDVFPSADTLEYVEGCVGEGEVCTKDVRKYSIRMVRLVKLVFIAGLMVPCVGDVIGIELKEAYSLIVIAAILVIAVGYEYKIIQILRKNRHDQ